MKRAFLLALLVVAGVVLAVLLTLPRSTPLTGAARDLAAPESSRTSAPSRPSRAVVAQWLRVSNEKLTAKAEDYQLDAPRRRDASGELLPFREHAASGKLVRELSEARPGDVLTLDLFPDARFRVRVTGRQSEGEEIRVFAGVEGHGEEDRFAMFWSPLGARGLLELPSRNRAYEIVRLPSGDYAAREWLFTDAVCARPVPDGGAADRGLPPAPLTMNDASSAAATKTSAVAAFNSRPSAAATIYLDFDGEVVSGTAWAGGRTINALPARMSAAQIEETWRRVANHFAVFEVNVTTDRAVYDNAPMERKTHCIITPTTDAAPGAGGVAYINSFTESGLIRKICWTFVDDRPDFSALVCSHEIGHTLGLLHHGRVATASDPREEYYGGHGTGKTGWGPFMGAPYGQNLLQWSKGEYTRANNSTQDDLMLITAPARIPFVADDHGDGTNNATAITSGVAVTGSVGRGSDADYFQLEIGTGQQPIALSLPVGTMLDSRLDVFDAAGGLLQSVNPLEELDLVSLLNLSTRRTVYLRVSGTAKPEVLGTGYSAYSCLGSYTLTVGNSLPSRVESLSASSLSASSIRLTWSASIAATSYRIFREDQFIAEANALAFTDSNLREDTSYTYRVVASNRSGEAATSDSASARTLTWREGNPYGFRVLDPATIRTLSGGLAYVFSGQMGTGLTNGVMWSNPATGRTGFLSSQADWSASIPLAGGINRVVFSAPYRVVTGTSIVAYDNAGDPAYYGGWLQGTHGGVGFGPWQLSATSADASHFKADRNQHTNMTVGTINGFGLRASNGATAVARRILLQPLAAEQSLTVSFDSNFIDFGRSAGVALSDGAGATRVGFRAVGGRPNFLIRDGAGERDSGIAYTRDGLQLQFELLPDNQYRLAAGTNQRTGRLATGGAVSTLVFSNESAGSGEARSFYVGNMTVRVPQITENNVRVTAPAVVLPASASLTVDGLPAWWWLEKFGTTNGVSAASDSDGDGASNAQEYAAGTNPADPTSRLAVLEVVREGDTLHISWDAVPGQTYVLETRASLAEVGWTPLDETGITAWADQRRLTRSIRSDGEAFFVRVRALP